MNIISGHSNAYMKKYPNCIPQFRCGDVVLITFDGTKVENHCRTHERQRLYLYKLQSRDRWDRIEQP